MLGFELSVNTNHRKEDGVIVEAMKLELYECDQKFEMEISASHGPHSLCMLLF